MYKWRYAAIKGEEINVSNWVDDINIVNRCEMCKHAISGNQLRTLKWLTKKIPESDYEIFDGENKLYLGEYTEGLDYILEEEELIDSLEIASTLGYVHILQWIDNDHNKQGHNLPERLGDMELGTIGRFGSGNLNVLRWLNVKGPIPDFVTEQAAASGHMDVIQWLNVTGNLHLSTHTMYSAVETSHERYELVRFLHENGCPWNELTVKTAARRGHFKILKYTISNGCPIDADALNNAVQKGSMDMVKFLFEINCPINEDALKCAVQLGSIEMIEYLRKEKRCPWNEETTETAAMSGNNDVLKYLINNGCPSSSWCCAYAAFHGDLILLKWLRIMGCEWDE